MFEFTQVYVLTDDTGAYMPVPQLAFGVKQTQQAEYDGAPKRLCVMYLTPNEVTPGHSIVVKTLDKDGDAIVVVDGDRQSDAGGPVVWRFDPLDSDLWAGMKDHIVGYDELNRQCPSIAQVREYYVQHWLDNGWWTEN